MTYKDAPYIDFFTITVWGDESVYQTGDKVYDIKLLSGPETTEAEYAYLKELNVTSFSDPGPADKNAEMLLYDVLRKSAFQMHIRDFDSHQQMLASIEQVYIPGTDKVFTRAVDYFHSEMVIGYMDRDQNDFLLRGDLDLIKINGKYIKLNDDGIVNVDPDI